MLNAVCSSRLMRTIPKLPADVIKGTVAVLFVYPVVLEATCGLVPPFGPAAAPLPPGTDVPAEMMF